MIKPMSDACELSRPKAAAAFRAVAEVFKALSNPNRLVIVDALAGGERCVADLTALLDLDMSTVSNHLSVLRQVGIVSDDRRGTQVFYRLRKPCLLNIFCCLEEFQAAAPSPAPTRSTPRASSRDSRKPTL